MKLNWDFKELTDFMNRLNDQKSFDEYLSKATQNIARTLHKMLITNTPVDFGTLRSFWETDENYSYLVEADSNGYNVTLINRGVYALWVNDGHSQRPGRFIPGRWDGKHFRYDPNANEGMVLKKPWVKGHFFVEKSILELENNALIENIIFKEIENWFGWCVNGK